MNIGMAVRRYGHVGGMEGVALAFSRWLVQQGHQVDVFCADAVTETVGVRLQPLPAYGRGVMWKAVSLQRALARLPLNRYDAFLHFERGGRGGTFRAGGGCHAAWAERRPNKWFDGWLSRIDKDSMVSAERVVANSRMAMSDIQKHYGISAEKLRLVRNGVDLERFQPGPSSPSPFVVFLGSDFQRKGLATAISAMSLVPGVSLKVLGKGRGDFASLASRLGVSERVEFMGHVECPERILASSQALILPTQYDPSSNACLEAMACGVPVVTTKYNGVAEILPHPWMIVSDPEDAEGCAGVLQRVLSSLSLGEECRAVAEHHSMHSSFSQLFAVLLEGRP
jgi:UDP-glucose:(heptosyl)LPS alpha-1,3-glucosyltransferase